MPLSLLEETKFWTRQFSEHLGLLAAMLQGSLRQEAHEHHQRYETLRKRVQHLDGGAMAATVEDATRDVHTFQSGICDRLDRGEWLGFAWPLFCDHITREVELYEHIAYGDPVPSGGVSAAVSQMGGEHALFAANLLDPTERAPSKTANEVGWKLVEMSKKPQGRSLMREEVALQKAIKEFIETTGLGTPSGAKSLVNLTLREHVLREQVYYAQKLQDAINQSRNSDTRYKRTRSLLKI
jgi:hypothetical protein